jgi:hypothetical protein
VAAAARRARRSATRSPTRRSEDVAAGLSTPIATHLRRAHSRTPFAHPHFAHPHFAHAIRASALAHAIRVRTSCESSHVVFDLPSRALVADDARVK